ncbi:MAG: signal peptidase II [Syntrophomonadaceae bacterium]|nr:signal peptidase II [Syntrophomonadaceae bacterium]
MLNGALFLLIALTAVAVDQLSKAYIASHMQPGDSLTIIPGILHITYVRNPGAAFGIFAYRTEFFITTAILFLFVVLVLLFYLPTDPKVTIPMSILTGGVLGNMIDRLRTRYVVDFIDFRIWPVLNIADIFIFIGAVFIFIYLFTKGGVKEVG